ncbi:hypothetical protein HNY73_009125 [Argiope bruennichi]|uniref:Uncharacterized protein n=1 Tax=Argiope bruennichi TaxID=94029 RepID=A0A8T0FB09_ARGBR|nr:hypothetical protein HNY73_009125 [Argiope bruennichi]
MADEKPTFDDDMRNDVYRFAHDLMTDVVKRSGKYVPFIKVPDPGTFLFTEARRIIVRKFLEKEGAYIEGLVEAYAQNFRPLNYFDMNYLENRDKIVAKFRPEPYSEEGFLKLCAALAHTAACILLRNENCTATVHAMNDVHRLMKAVLSRGTLQCSSLPGNIAALLTPKDVNYQ